jgi:hypothetical protein
MISFENGSVCTWSRPATVGVVASESASGAPLPLITRFSFSYLHNTFSFFRKVPSRKRGRVCNFWLSFYRQSHVGLVIILFCLI